MPWGVTRVYCILQRVYKLVAKIDDFVDDRLPRGARGSTGQRSEP
jgi:hypothetical protein